MTEDQIKVLKIVQSMLSTNFNNCSGDCTSCKANIIGIEELEDCDIDLMINEIQRLIE